MVVTDEKSKFARSVLILMVTESLWKLIRSLRGLGGSNEVFVESDRVRSFPKVLSRQGSHTTGSRFLATVVVMVIVVLMIVAGTTLANSYLANTIGGREELVFFTRRLSR